MSAHPPAYQCAPANLPAHSCKYASGHRPECQPTRRAPSRLPACRKFSSATPPIYKLTAASLPARSPVNQHAPASLPAHDSPAHLLKLAITDTPVHLHVVPKPSCPRLPAHSRRLPARCRTVPPHNCQPTNAQPLLNQHTSASPPAHTCPRLHNAAGPLAHAR